MKKLLLAQWTFLIISSALGRTNVNIFTDTTEQLHILYDILDTKPLKNIMLKELLQRNDLTYYFIPDEAKIAQPEQDYYLRFKILNLSSEALYLSGFRYFDYEIIYGNKQIGFKSDSGCITQSLFERRFAVNNIVIPISYSTDTITAYIHLKSPIGHGLGFLACSAEFLHNKDILNFIFYTFYISICCFTFIFAITLLIRIGEWVYLFYSLYVLSIILYSLSSWGFTTALYSISKNGFYVQSIFFALMTVFLLSYSSTFLKTKKYYPILHKLIISGIVIRIVGITLSYFLSKPEWNNSFFDSILLFPSLVAGILSYRSGNKFIRYYIISFLIIYCGVIYHSSLEIYFNNQYLSPFFVKYFSEWGYFFYSCTIIELILFTVGIVERLLFAKNKERTEQTKIIAFQNQIIEQEKKNLLLEQNMNIELDNKVKLRTHELEEANLLLAQQADEIKRMNVLLSLDNEKLHSDIESLKKARLLGKGVGFTEFEDTFPSDDSVYSLLSQLKWGQTYACRKCGYKRYITGQTNFGRKCRSCGYDESATYATVLENIKFSPQKALYIVHHLLVNEEINAKKISEELSLRLATCYAFIRKIHQTVLADKKNKHEDWTKYLEISKNDKKA